MQAVEHLIMWLRPTPMLNEHEPLIINAIGHMAGAIVFGIFLALALRGNAGRRSGQSLLSVASAALAWLWNTGSFATLLLPAGSLRWAIEAASFCSLSLLPAVLLNLSLNRRSRMLAIAGYILSGAATVMHLCEGLQPALPLHKWALWLITFGFGTLTIVYAVGSLRREKEARGRTSQILASMCLLLFAVTFSHFGAGHPPQPWKELLVHHAGIPIALLILLQDYRFVFLDAFVRFLANVILAAILAYAGLRAAASLMPDNSSPHPLADVIGVSAFCALLILFAYLRGIVQRLLTRAVFRGSRTEGAAQELRAKAAESRNEADYLQWAAERLAAVAETPRFELLPHKAMESRCERLVLDHPALADDQPWVLRDARWNWAEAIVPIRISHGNVRYILLGRRRGGRRYLSEDLRSLNSLATIAGEEMDRCRAVEMQRLVSEAELRALHSQINPHFLFNALNTIYGIIPREAAGARRTVLNLADIFRYFLQSDKILIPLSEELKIVKAYLEIERLRLGPRLQTIIQVDKEVEQTLIPVLSVQPLVENAIKHGVSTRPDEGWLRLSAQKDGGTVTISVEDSGPGGEAGGAEAFMPGAGVGLSNVSRRLQLCFGLEADVKMEQGAFGTRVAFSVPRAQEPAAEFQARMTRA
jgi:two-component system, LytTR family, sensor kinase